MPIVADDVEVVSPTWGARAKHIRVPVEVVVIVVVYLIVLAFV